MFRRSPNMAFLMPPGVQKTGPTQGESGRQEDNPQGPPPKKPGDAYLIAVALIGVVLGGAVGFLVSGGIGGLLITILCTAGGALIGGTVGAWLGEKLEARIARRLCRTERHDSND